MELIPWAPGTGPSFEETMELYRSSFPPNELREEASQRRIMKDPAYKYLLAREKQTGWDFCSAGRQRTLYMWSISASGRSSGGRDTAEKRWLFWEKAESL